jgi:hypothetical protein
LKIGKIILKTLAEKSICIFPPILKHSKRGYYKEVENLKGKWLVFAVLPLLMLALVPTILAEPAQKIPVTAVTFNQVNGPFAKDWTTDGGIVHRVFTRTGNVMLAIDGQAPIVGTLSEGVHTMINTKTGEMVIQNFDAIWTFTGGSFAGVKQTRVTGNYPVVDELEQHVVFQGTGIYEGCTLMLSVDAPPFPPTYIGTMLVH